MRLQTIFNRKLAILATVAIVLLALPTVSGAVTAIITGSQHAASPSLALQKPVHEAANQKKVVPKRHSSANGLLPVVDQQDITEAQRIIADNTLRSLPSQCRDNLRTFYVNYEPNPRHRGLGGADTIIIAGLVPDNEFRALLIHECGHVVDLGGFRGTASAGLTEFFDGNEPIYANDPSIAFYRISWDSANQRKLTASKADFVSGYAMSDPFEDFAESFAYYILQKQQFAKLAKKNKALAAKYAWFEKNISTEIEMVAMGKHVRGAKEPWDVTKLPYTWMN
jgi:hypothetical protein